MAPKARTTYNFGEPYALRPLCVPSFIKKKKKKNIYIYTHTHTHTHIYICIHIRYIYSFILFYDCVCVCMKTSITQAGFYFASQIFNRPCANLCLMEKPFGLSRAFAGEAGTGVAVP